MYTEFISTDISSLIILKFILPQNCSYDFSKLLENNKKN